MEENRSPGRWSPWTGPASAHAPPPPPPQLRAASPALSTPTSSVFMPPRCLPGCPPFPQHPLARTILCQGLDPSSTHRPPLTTGSHPQGGAALQQAGWGTRGAGSFSDRLVG